MLSELQNQAEFKSLKNSLVVTKLVLLIKNIEETYRMERDTYVFQEKLV